MNMLFPSKNYLRKSTLIFAICLNFVFTLLPFFIHGHINFIPIILSLLLIIISIFTPYYLKNPYYAWIKLGKLLGKLNTSLILAIFFYIVIVPAALIRKLIKLKLFRNKVKSYYIISDLTNKINFKDQF